METNEPKRMTDADILRGARELAHYVKGHGNVQRRMRSISQAILDELHRRDAANLNPKWGLNGPVKRVDFAAAARGEGVER